MSADKTVNSLYPIPLWQFVLALQAESASEWDEFTLDWIVDKLNVRGDEILFHKSASNSSLADYVKLKSINLAGKTAHCDVQHSIWKLNLDAGNESCPIDPLWSENKYRFFRDGFKNGSKAINSTSFKDACEYAIELSRRPYKRTGRGVICPAKDGCFCRSMEEVRIDDWLFENGIHHEKEPNYPKHPILNKGGRKRADWKVGKTFIEYAGLMSDSQYKKKLEDKITLAKEMGINLIVLIQSDLQNLENALKIKLNL